MRLVVGVKCKCLGAQCARDRPAVAHPLAVVVGDEVGGTGVSAAVLARVHIYRVKRFDEVPSR